MTARSFSLSASRRFASSVSPETRHLFIPVLVAGATMATTLVLGIPSNYDAPRIGHYYSGWSRLFTIRTGPLTRTDTLCLYVRPLMARS